MEWWFVLSIIIGTFLFFLALSVPVAMAFLAANIMGLYVFGEGPRYLNILSVGMFDSVNTFVLIAVPLFMLMGDLLLRCGFVKLITDAVESLVGMVPGRLGVLTVGVGTILGALTGVPIASVATLGTTLVPEMVRQGYRPWLAYGSAMSSGGLAMLIPPSALAIIVAFAGHISPAKVLIGGAGPGLVCAALFATFIIAVCKIRPNLAPEVASAPRMRPVARFVTVAKCLPLLWIIFLVTGVIMMGVATPTEAAALGASGSFILTIVYRRLSWRITTESLLSTLRTTCMVFLILACSKTFSQVLILTGAGQGLVSSITGLPLPPFAILCGMLLIVLVLGCFMDAISLTLITVPMFLPTVIALGFDPIWFAIMVVICLGVGGMTPPVGMHLYAMKGVYPTAMMSDIIRGAVPFFILQAMVLALTLAFPPIALWLPNLIV